MNRCLAVMCEDSSIETEHREKEYAPKYPIWERERLVKKKRLEPQIAIWVAGHIALGRNNLAL